MVEIILDPIFEDKVKKIKDSFTKVRIEKLIDKIINSPEIGKPMKYGRKGIREIYLGSFRLSYAYVKEGNKIILLDIYHKDQQ